MAAAALYDHEGIFIALIQLSRFYIPNDLDSGFLNIDSYLVEALYSPSTI